MTDKVGDRHFDAEDVIRLKELIREGVQIQREVEDLKGGLSDTVKAIAEELEIKPAQLNKVIRTVHKNSLDDDKSALDEIEELIQIYHSKNPRK